MHRICKNKSAVTDQETGQHIIASTLENTSDPVCLVNRINGPELPSTAPIATGSQSYRAYSDNRLRLILIAYCVVAKKPDTRVHL
ncbi:hypothetical protein QE152_g30776 [Popillia japonica]|uniref:Uncharacterized protein n=1 Tax=Popillia japonica TaxID=7064 RepID=A0AAW1JDK8_POPJA